MPLPEHLALHSLALLASIVLLWRGADSFVDAATRVAERFHVSELVIGLTLVGLGTSAPEFAVSISAAIGGKSDISIANVVGSNAFNLGFILGGCAAVRPLLATRALVYRDGIFLIALTSLIGLFLRDGGLERWEGGVLLAVLATYLSFLFRQRQASEEEKKQRQEQAASTESEARFDHIVWDLFVVLFTLGVIVLGGKLLVWGASGVARAAGMSEWAIGVTVIAAGTSAPELFTSLNAALKGRFGLSAGNLIGSDIYNFLGVLGVSSMIRPLEASASAMQSMWLVVGGVTLVVVFMRSGWRVSRWEGVVLIVINVARWIYETLHGRG